MKKYQIKAYNSDGVFIENVSPDIVMSDISFNSEINGGQGELKIDLNMDWDDPEPWTKPFNFIRVIVIDPKNPRGRILYTGFISQRNPMIDGSVERVELTCLGLVSLLALSMYKDGNSFTVTHTNEDPGAIARAVIDHFQAVYPGTPEWIGYDEVLTPKNEVVRAGGGIIDSGTNVTYEFDQSTWGDAFDELIDLAAGDWHWFVHPTGDIQLKEKAASAQHILTVGKHVQALEAPENTEEIKNAVTVNFDGGSTAPQEDAQSIADYGRRDLVEDDNEIKDGGTALIKAQSIRDSLKDPKVQAAITINSTIDYEAIQPGDTLRLRNYKKDSVTLGDNMLVVSVNYGPETCVVELEGIKYDLTKELKLVAS